MQEVRDDRDHHVKENHDLKAEVVKHFAELDKLARKTKDLEVCVGYLYSALSPCWLSNVAGTFSCCRRHVHRK